MKIPFLRTLAVTGVAAVGLGIAAPALAWVNAEGGLWDYGTTAQSVYSNYYHGKVCHGSTAAGVNVYRSPNTKAGNTSYASGAKKDSGNQAFYRTSC